MGRNKKGGGRRYTDLRCELLQEEMDRRHSEQRRETGQRLTDMNRAIDKAEAEMNRRLEGMNEFRDAMRDQAARMMTRDAFDLASASDKDRNDVAIGSLGDRMDRIEAAYDRMRGAVEANTTGRAERRLDLGQVIAVIAVLVAIASAAITAIVVITHG